MKCEPAQSAQSDINVQSYVELSGKLQPTGLIKST